MKKSLVLICSTALLGSFIAPTLPTVNSQSVVSAATYEMLGSQTGIGNQVLRITNTNGARRIDHNGNTVQTPLQYGTEWKTNTKAIDANGNVWYNVSDDQWVSQNDVWVKGMTYAFDNYKTYPIQEIATITNPNGTEIYDINGKPTGRVLPLGTAWKTNVFGTDLTGKTWYCVGDNQYIATNDSTTNRPESIRCSFYDPVTLGAYTMPGGLYSGVAANLDHYPRGTKLLITYNGQSMIRTVNDTGAFAYSNPNQIDIAMPTSQIPSIGIWNNAQVTVIG